MKITLIVNGLNPRWYKVGDNQDFDAAYICSEGLLRHGILSRGMMSAKPSKLVLSLLLNNPKKRGFKKIWLREQGGGTSYEVSSISRHRDLLLTAVACWIERNLAGRVGSHDFPVWVKLTSVIQ